VAIGHQFREMADFRTLLAFANHSHTEQSWRRLFRVLTTDDSRTEDGRLGRYITDAELRQSYRIKGEPFSDSGAHKLQQYVREVLAGLIDNHIQFSTSPVPLVFSYHPKAGLHTHVQHGDLRVTYDWLIFELIRQGKHHLLARCAECGDFFVRARKTAKYCKEPCRKWANRRPGR
jgi:hypothetical protein